MQQRSYGYRHKLSCPCIDASVQLSLLASRTVYKMAPIGMKFLKVTLSLSYYNQLGFLCVKG